MRVAIVVLALAALCAALFAAWNWYKVSQGDQRPLKAAAIWTGIAVVLGALSSVAGVLSPGVTRMSAPFAAPMGARPLGVQSMEGGMAPAPMVGAGGPAAMRQICRPDFQKLCPDAKPGGGIAACIRQNRASFSDPCKSAIAAARAAWMAQSGPRAAMRQACLPDFQKLCPDAKPGAGGAIAMCIRQNHASFSDSCKTAIAQMRAQRRQQSAGAGAAPSADVDPAQ